ncbi:MAG TPA: hypothetical protein VGR12_03570 [Solirubrobacteraceae bacterium]|nr:hypothetical protein [Solirubrobacteraceae bacterium]
MATEQEKKAARASTKLTWHEFLAMGGGALLAISIFLSWYSGENSRATIGGNPVPQGGGDFTGWEVHTIIRWLLLAAAAAPFILAYIVARGHKLSWARGEMTAVTSIAALGLIVYNGVIGQPGEPKGLIGVEYGWFLALIGVLAMLIGSALRASEVERARKPPGVL